MDIVTQGLVGASLAQVGAKKAQVRLATFIGFCAGLLADADYLIRSSEDSLLNIEYHRHFSHSVFFIPIGALIAAILLWPIVKKHIDFKSLYFFSLLGYGLSGFIDACTSYGTHLFWPFIDQALAFNIISIIDPIFTLTLLIAVFISIKQQNAKATKIGLIIVSIYLCLGWLQQQRVTEVSRNLAEQRGHQIERLLVKPTLGNNVLWRSVYQYKNNYYVDAIRVASSERVYEGYSITMFNINDIDSIPRTSILYRDLQRFDKFSNQFTALSSERDNFIFDVRYSILPNSLKPLWGINIDMSAPDKHAHYQVFRDNNKAIRQQFLAMLFGQELDL